MCHNFPLKRVRSRLRWILDLSHILILQQMAVNCRIDNLLGLQFGLRQLVPVTSLLLWSAVLPQPLPEITVIMTIVLYFAVQVGIRWYWGYRLLDRCLVAIKIPAPSGSLTCTFRFPGNMPAHYSTSGAWTHAKFI